MDERYKPFYKKIWETKCARFNAHKRCENLEVRSQMAVVLLTSAVLAISIFKVAGQLNVATDLSNAGDIALVVFSVGLLTLELYVKGRKFSDSADVYHKSGLDISRVYDDFILEVSKPIPNDARIQEIISKYHDALERGKNHTDIDFQLVRYEHPNDYALTGFSFYVGWIVNHGKFFCYSGGLFVVAALLVCVATVFAITKYGI
jgi:hypothetical protein